MLNLDVEEEQISKFIDPKYWTKYFPPKAKEDLSRFGVHVDWRRSFITTEANPYYDSFIRWHFTKLKEAEFIRFGTRPSIFCIKDNQMCADHDRAVGEHVNPQEYTLIKIKLLDLCESLSQLKDREVFLVAATLRPETMYGQTNCFILPNGVYGCFEAKNNEIYICSERSALNMAHQNTLKEDKKVEKICEVKGSDLIGLGIKAPLTPYEKLYVWPMLSISMGKGTGVVTSVPSDAPDDYAVLMDLVNKEAFRKKFGLTDEQVLPFEPLSIIDIPEYSDMSAKKAYKEFKIKSSNDKDKLILAKDLTYKLGFNKGILKVGEFKGQKIKDVKDKIKAKMIEDNEAVTYYEPENRVVSRSGEECIVAYTDQWYIPYGEDEFQKKVLDHINGEEFESYNPHIKEAFNFAINWLKEWGCSRSFGLGTRLPWDEKYLIESLSDSTIYMSYYTVAHFLQEDIYGEKVGSLGIKASDLTTKDWDYIYLNKEYDTEKQKIEEDKLKTMRDEFRYWYPVDLRVSGKDLIRNHLSMSLYNHSVVWEGENMMPRGFFCNGWILVDNKKMSKSEGNFYTLKQLCTNFGADASRIALAAAGDTLEDANLVIEEVNQGILKLSALEMWMKDSLSKVSTFREETVEEDNISFYDIAFENELNKLTYDSIKAYDKLVMRKVVEYVFFGMQKLREDYNINCGVHGMKKDLFLKYIEYQLVLLYPMAPHFTEIIWKDLFLPSIGDLANNYKELISYAEIPEIKEEIIDYLVLDQFAYIKKLSKSMNSSFETLTKKSKKKKKKNKQKPVEDLKDVYVIIAREFNDWQKAILSYLSKEGLTKENSKTINWKGFVSKEMAKHTGEIEGKKKKSQFMSKGFAFAANMMKEHSVKGDVAYNLSIAFDEEKLIKSSENAILRDLKQFNSIKIIDIKQGFEHELAQVQILSGKCMPGNPEIVFD